jgi:hypothetical protein
MTEPRDKYTPLREYLAAAAERGEEAVYLDFSDIDRLIDGLPPAAYSKRQWWANGRQAQAQAWQDAGWRVDTVGFARRRVAFARLG